MSGLICTCTRTQHPSLLLYTHAARRLNPRACTWPRPAPAACLAVLRCHVPKGSMSSRPRTPSNPACSRASPRESSPVSAHPPSVFSRSRRWCWPQATAGVLRPPCVLEFQADPWIQNRPRPYFYTTLICGSVASTPRIHPEGQGIKSPWPHILFCIFFVSRVQLSPLFHLQLSPSQSTSIDPSYWQQPHHQIHGVLGSKLAPFCLCIFFPFAQTHTLSRWASIPVGLPLFQLFWPVHFPPTMWI